MSAEVFFRPNTVHVAQPDLSKPLQHALRFYQTVLKSILGSHRLLLKHSPAYVSKFSLSQSQQQQWLEVFDASSDKWMPFTYANISATMSLMHILAEQGINFKFLRHLKSEITYECLPFHVGRAYSVTTVLSDIVALREDRVALVTMTTLRNEYSEVLTLQEDYWAIMKLPVKDVARLKDVIIGFGYHDANQFQNLTKRQPCLRDAPCINIFIPSDMGLRYGKISGDLNPTHISALMARVFNQSRPFIQGFCTLNYVIKHLTELMDKPLHALNITFVRPVYIGEQVRLHYTDNHFEICNQRGELLAAGGCTTQ